LSAATESFLSAVFILFCRTGACLGFAPGFSSPRIPMRVRLFVALGITAAFTPTLAPEQVEAARNWTTSNLVAAIMSELVIGSLLGLGARFLIAALETMATAISMSIGLTSNLAPRVDESEQLPELATLVTFATATLIFVTDLHWQMIGALAESYQRFPLGAGVAGGLGLARLVDALSFGFPLALRIASPFLVFGFVANFAFGLVNKVVPQIAIYFISQPFILAGGLALLYATSTDLLSLFLTGFARWLTQE
jgi:flagellar biosynthesis protein FliR